jgi:regulatory protein
VIPCLPAGRFVYFVLQNCTAYPDGYYLFSNLKTTSVLRRKQLTREQAYQKLKHYCTYQDRCHSELKNKAYSLGLRKIDVEELTARLIEENALSEERFAIKFAGGKFRMKQWGKAKIISELRKKRVNDYLIKKAIKEITNDDYMKTVFLLAKKKWKGIKGKDVRQFVKMTKTRDYLLQKGYEAAVIAVVLKKLQE